MRTISRRFRSSARFAPEERRSSRSRRSPPRSSWRASTGRGFAREGMVRAERVELRSCATLSSALTGCCRVPRSRHVEVASDSIRARPMEIDAVDTAPARGRGRRARLRGARPGQPAAGGAGARPAAWRASCPPRSTTASSRASSGNYFRPHGRRGSRAHRVAAAGSVRPSGVDADACARPRPRSHPARARSAARRVAWLARREAAALRRRAGPGNRRRRRCSGRYDAGRWKTREGHGATRRAARPLRAGRRRARRGGPAGRGRRGLDEPLPRLRQRAAERDARRRASRSGPRRQPDASTRSASRRSARRRSARPAWVRSPRSRRGATTRRA